jgi:hypothetical protein
MIDYIPNEAVEQQPDKFIVAMKSTFGKVISVVLYRGKKYSILEFPDPRFTSEKQTIYTPGEFKLGDEVVLMIEGTLVEEAQP